MAIRVVPKWAKWLFTIGLFAPILGAFAMENYNPQLSLWGNVQSQDVILPFFRGQNPIECANESLRMIASVAVNQDVHRSQFCSKPTRLPYRYLLFASIVALAFGVYRMVNPVALANKWPTQWRGDPVPPEKAEAGSRPPVKPQVKTRLQDPETDE